MNELLRSLRSWESWMAEAVNEPDWEKTQRVHDWRNHVPDAFKSIWGRLSEETRLVIIITADEKASEEEWD